MLKDIPVQPMTVITGVSVLTKIGGGLRDVFFFFAHSTVV
jgi:hypothetical protein